MNRLLSLLSLLFLFALVEARQGATIPSTPAGERLRGYLAAFNSGRRDTLRTYLQENMEGPPDQPGFAAEVAEGQHRTYRLTGAFDLRRIGMSEVDRIQATVQGRRTGAWTELTLFVDGKPPHRIVGMGFRDTPPPPDLLPRQRLTDREIRERTAALMRKLAADDGFSGVVYVARHGRPIYQGAFGLASKAWNRPNRIDTKFNLASITKMFTAVAIAQLVERGKLSYSDSVGKVLPDYPNREVADRVTIHHLLSHTSGMIDARRLVERGDDDRRARTIDEMLKPFAADPLDFTPGERFSYSNAGFILLGKIVEKVSGERYFDYVAKHIFRPAGMGNTDFYELDRETPNLATGYADGPNGTRVSNIFDLGVIGSPAGGAYSTAQDLDRFHHALVDGTLLKAESRNALWRRVTEGYGYGSHVIHYNGQRIVGHGGGWKGITNAFEAYPDLGCSVVVLSNYDVEPGIVTNLLRGWLTQGLADARRSASVAQK